MANNIKLTHTALQIIYFLKKKVFVISYKSSQSIIHTNAETCGGGKGHYSQKQSRQAKPKPASQSITKLG